MTETTALTVPTDIAALNARLTEDMERLDSELGEVDLLITQAKTEAVRHDTRRNAAAEKVTAFPKDGDAAELAELNAQMVNLTKRAALMESQVDVLEGKRRALARHRDTIAAYAALTGAMDPATPIAPAPPPPAPKGKRIASGAETDAVMPPAVSRLVLTAQEDMRREIARAMHDGPAQSLTNIVLQAQIVERLVGKDPTQAKAEVRQLVGMVQQTLDATKTFIFDVRPMVLDDLGLVATLRRATRERGQRAGVPTEFESMGQDRRLPMELESGLFRLLDEALVAYLQYAPQQVALHLDWSPEQLQATVTATRAPVAAAAAAVEHQPAGRDLPPALAAMMEDRKADARDAAEAARKQGIAAMPPTTWHEIQSRAETIGVAVELLQEDAQLHLVAELPPELPA